MLTPALPLIVYPANEYLSMYWPYVLGYLFATIGPNMMPTVSVPLWKRLGKDPDKLGENPLYDPYIGRVVGTIERPLYVAALLADQPAFIGIWLGLKVAGSWSRWSGDSDLPDGGKVAGRSVFNIMLIGSAVSLIWSLVAAKIIQFLQWGDYVSAISMAAAVVGAHYGFNNWLVRNIKKKS